MKKSPATNTHETKGQGEALNKRKIEGNRAIKPFLPLCNPPPPPAVAYGRGGEALRVTPVSVCVSQPTSQLVYVYVHVAAGCSSGGWGGGQAMRSGCWSPQPQVRPRCCSRPLTATTAIHLAPERGAGQFPPNISRQKTWGSFPPRPKEDPTLLPALSPLPHSVS